MTQTPLQILRDARELIADERRWTQKAFARDEYDNEIGDSRSAACRWCMIGAVYHVASDESVTEPTAIAVTALRKAVPDSCIDIFNDTHTHPEVLAAMDAAIASLEKETRP